MTAKTKTKRVLPSQPDALPARFTLRPQAFVGMTAATLKRPYNEPLYQFTKWLEDYFERVPQKRNDETGRPIRPQPPYRLLNDTLTACAPTIVHGFEWYENNKNDRGHRMIAVGRSSQSEENLATIPVVAFPSANEVADVMRLWLKQWGERPWLKAIIEGEGKLPWESLMTSVAEPPDTKWIEGISAEKLLETGEGLGYEVIPSLIATLLHETESSIGPNREAIQWRRMQEGSSGRYCIVSQPLPVEFLKKNKQTGETQNKNGYFSYKIEVELQTQAGRKEQWLYLSLHCMRYAHLPLSFNKRGNEVTILVRANQARLQDWKVDSTLVRLKVTPNASSKSRDKVIWLEDLPPLLTELKARPLVTPSDLYDDPIRYWRKSGEVGLDDEYYLLHTEGYRYKGNQGHSVLTGFGLVERAEVLGSLCTGALRDYIEPDAAMRADPRCFEENDKPKSLYTFADLTPSIALENLSHEEKFASSAEESSVLRKGREAVRDAKQQQQQQQNRPIMAEALQRATRGKTLVIACFHREANTADLLEAKLREAFQIDEDCEWPTHLNVITPHPLIPSHGMMQPLEHDGNTRRKDNEVALWRDKRIAEWDTLLKQTFGDYLNREDVICAAIVELDKKTHTENRATKITPDRRSIHSVIRQACGHNNILSQMIVTPDKLTGVATRDSAANGKAQQTVQDLTTRQIGAMYAPPSDLYLSVGLDKFGRHISGTLDVIALSFCTTQTGVNYCLATRLRADGTIDVLLSENDADWIPYSKAGLSLGQMFAHERKNKYIVHGKIKDASRHDPNRQSKARKTQPKVNAFVETLLTEKLERPTIVIVEAEKWRSKRQNGGDWWQLQNQCLEEYENCLVFGNRFNAEEQRCYEHGKPNPSSTHGHLLGIVRLRAAETPQYVTNRQDWKVDDRTLMRNYFELTGFIDQTTTDVFHYFSVGRLPAGAGGPQHKRTLPDPFKIVSGAQSGGGVAYRHPPMIEMVPFFVHPDFASDDGKSALCRVSHYLRFSPAWAMGNLDSPYPLHLGDVLIQDQLCILGLGDD